MKLPRGESDSNKTFHMYGSGFPGGAGPNKKGGVLNPASYFASSQRF